MNVLFSTCMSTSMEVVIDYGILEGSQNDSIVKDISLAANGIIQSLHFRSPYGMRPHGSGRKWAELGWRAHTT